MQRKHTFSRWPMGDDAWTLPPKRRILFDSRVEYDCDGNLVATAPIEAGAVLFVERPLAFMISEPPYALPRVVTSARSEYWLAYHILRHKLGGKRLFKYLLANCPSHKVSLDMEPADSACFDYMRNRCSGISKKMLCLLIAVIQRTINHHVSSILRLVMGMGLYETLGTIPHSCEPNAQAFLLESGRRSLPGAAAAAAAADAGTVHVKALRPISAKEHVSTTLHDAMRWTLNPATRKELLAVNYGISSCQCVRCGGGRGGGSSSSSSSSGPSYDKQLLLAMLKDIKTRKMLKKNPEMLIYELEMRVYTTNCGIYLMEDLWHTVAAKTCTCAMLRFRIARTYINAFLRMSADDHNVFVLANHLIQNSGFFAGIIPEECTARHARFVSPAEIACGYERAINELEALHFQRLDRLRCDRIRLYLFRAVLSIQEMSGDVPDIDSLTMTPQIASFIRWHSLVMNEIQSFYGTAESVRAEARKASACIDAVFKMGRLVEKWLSTLQ